MTRSPSPTGARRLARDLGLRAPTVEQARVVEAPLEPMLVVAGAGSGKTETMAARVVWLVANGLVRPEEVLALTFTRKAASELAERTSARLGRLNRRHRAGSDLVSQERPRVATYNSYAAGLVRDHGLRIGIDPDAHLLSEAGRWQLATKVVEGWGGDLSTPSAPSTVVAAVLDLGSALAEHLIAPQEAAVELTALAQTLGEKAPASGRGERPGPRAEVRAVIESLQARAELMAVVEAFARRKQKLGVMDFADQMALACRVAREVPGVRHGERTRYRVVLLDEYQDTSVAQVALLAALFGEGHAVTAVGDPHQAIYGWRGASAGSVERFPGTFPRRGGEPAQVATLTTSWRNDRAILRVANTLAGPLRAAALDAPAGRVRFDLPVLGARSDAPAGRVTALYAQTAHEEAHEVAHVVAELRRASAPGAPSASAAVLCRTRAQMPAVADALRARGVPVEVVGLGGLLSTPEVADLHAALLVAHDPSRGDAAMRLLTGLRLGIADLAALHDHARELGNEAAAAGGRRTALLSDPDAAGLVDAIERPPSERWRSRSGRALTPSANGRIRQLGKALRAIRSQSHLPLPELVATAERLLGLDIAVLAQRGPGQEARRHLDAFADVAAEFDDGSRESTLGAFLGWLEAAAEHERGLETVEPEVDDAAVQVLTVHAAKGLEWDVVAVVGLSDGAFPAYDGPPRAQPASSAWLTALGSLPYPLREDAEDLPPLDVDGPADHLAMAEELTGFRLLAGAHLLAEERRLAYVAVTRARRDLVLAGSWWKELAQRPREPSRFLRELRRSGDVEVTGDPGWDEPADAENPLSSRPTTVSWPVLPSPEQAEETRRSVAAVEAARARLFSSERAPREDVPSARSARAAEWARDANLLLAERDRASRPDREVVLPPHLSASAVVRLVADPAAFARERRRPVPQQPAAGARRGTRFHEWVQRHFGAATLLDVEDLTGIDDASGSDLELDVLQQAFLSSPWAGRTPIGVEVALETPVAGTMVRCRVDAVFATDDGVEIVDWKTGELPRSDVDAQARQVQLALYRLAWSRLHDVPLESVGAAFYHVRQDVIVAATPMGEEEIVAVVEAGLAPGSGAARVGQEPVGRRDAEPATVGTSTRESRPTSGAPSSADASSSRRSRASATTSG